MLSGAQSDAQSPRPAGARRDCPTGVPRVARTRLSYARLDLTSSSHWAVLSPHERIFQQHERVPAPEKRQWAPKDKQAASSELNPKRHMLAIGALDAQLQAPCSGAQLRQDAWRRRSQSLKALPHPRSLTAPSSDTHRPTFGHVKRYGTGHHTCPAPHSFRKARCYPSGRLKAIHLEG